MINQVIIKALTFSTKPVFQPQGYWVLVWSLDPWDRLRNAGSVLRAKMIQENGV